MAQIVFLVTKQQQTDFHESSLRKARRCAQYHDATCNGKNTAAMKGCKVGREASWGLKAEKQLSKKTW